MAKPRDEDTVDAEPDPESLRRTRKWTRDDVEDEESEDTTNVYEPRVLTGPPELPVDDDAPKPSDYRPTEKQPWEENLVVPVRSNRWDGRAVGGRGVRGRHARGDQDVDAVA